MVATRLTTLNLDDHRNIRHLTRHREHFLDVLDRAGLETHPREAIIAQLLDQGDGVVAIRHAGGNHHAINRRAVLAGTLD